MARNTNVHSSKQQHQRRNSTRLEKAAQEGGDKNMPTGRILLDSDYAPTDLLPPVAASVSH
jgi:hypothetical protein